MDTTQITASALVLGELTKQAGALERTPHYSDFLPGGPITPGKFQTFVDTRHPWGSGLSEARLSQWFNDAVKAAPVLRPPLKGAGGFDIEAVMKSLMNRRNPSNDSVRARDAGLLR